MSKFNRIGIRILSAETVRIPAVKYTGWFETRSGEVKMRFDECETIVKKIMGQHDGR